MAIFEHGGESEQVKASLWDGFPDSELERWLDLFFKEDLLLQLEMNRPTVAGEEAADLFRIARELERRQLAAAPKINHEKFLERLDRDLHEGRFTEDYPGQHPLSKARVS